jgi:hypothetical protein
LDTGARPDCEGPAWETRQLRLTHPALDFWVDVTVYERDGRYMAAADLAEDSRDIGVGDTPQEAVKAALAALGEPYSSEMAEGVEPAAN